MKKLIMFSMVIAIALPVLSGIASAQVEPVCIQVCPTDAGPGDEVTLTAFDENGEQVDLTEWTGGVESNFAGCDPLGFFDQADEDGTVTFELTDCWYNNEAWDFFIFVPGGAGWGSYDISGGESPHANVADAIAAGGTCEDKSCDQAAPAIAVDSNDMPVYEPEDAGGPPVEGPTDGQLLVSLAWQPGEPTYPAFICTVTVDPNIEGDGPNDDFFFPGSDPFTGTVTLSFTDSNWDDYQNVIVQAVKDLDREGDESYPVGFTFTINIADPNFISDPCDPVTTSITVVDNDVPFVSAIPDEIELSENDPCCVDLKVRLSHLPWNDVYVRLYSEEWAFDAEMVYLDPPLEPEGLDPNILTFTVSGNPTWDPCTMTSNWDVEQTVTVCPIDNDELAEAWLEYIEGIIYMPSYSQDVRYLVPWWNPDGSGADDPCTPEEGEESDGEAGETIVVIVVQDNECGAQGYAPQDYNEDCSVGLADFVHFYDQWLICTEPYDDAGDCDKLWNLVE